MTRTAYEVNFDGLVGPTHSYAGLAYGNLASQANQSSVSNPREAALQGLAKMKLLADLGVKQAVLPPQERPDMQALRRLGFSGSDAQILEKVHRDDPVLLAACSSSSSMWAANAATISPSADCADGRVHITPANLVSQFHRSLETRTTAAVLKAIFKDESAFVHHAPLPACPYFGDEGAANHTRLCRGHGEAGVEVFAFGRRYADLGAASPSRFPARQTIEASAAIARLHSLEPTRTVFVQQNPAAIDAGVFHNDVIALGNENVLLYHADAYVDAPRCIERIRSALSACDSQLMAMEVSSEELSLADAVATYLFNSQLVTLPDGTMALIAPTECRQSVSARRVIERIVAAENPIRQVHYVDVRQSMQNGGGPACLRLRCVLTEEELGKAHQGVMLTNALHAQLESWVRRHYRERLEPGDLADVRLLEEGRAALDELTRILGLGSIYPFQGAADAFS
jgi:succinylarginine dihydrolase